MTRTRLLLTAIATFTTCLVSTLRCQSVDDVELGITSVAQVVRLRGAPSDYGQTNDGWQYVSFGAPPSIQTVLYFAEEDSIIDWVRVLPEPGRTAARVHEALGKPDTTEFTSDLSRVDLYAGGRVSVRYDNNDFVRWIEYHEYPYRSLGVRRFDRIEASIDTLIAKRLSDGKCAGPACQAFDTALDSALTMHIAALTRDSTPKGKAIPLHTRQLAALRDSLCLAIDCGHVLVTRGAFNGDPTFRPAAAPFTPAPSVQPPAVPSVPRP